MLLCRLSDLSGPVTTRDPETANISCYPFSSDQYRKRVPMREPGGKQDIFVSRSTRFGALKARAISLLDSGSQPVFLHAMGAAITLCCNLALTIQAECGGHVMLGVQTTTVQVYDDYEPLEEVLCRYESRVLDQCMTYTCTSS